MSTGLKNLVNYLIWVSLPYIVAFLFSLFTNITYYDFTNHIIFISIIGPATILFTTLYLFLMDQSDREGINFF